MATNLNFRTSGPYTLNTVDTVKTAGLTNADIDNNFFTVQQKKFDNHGYVSGDIFYANASGNVVRLAKGTDGQVLQLTSGFPAWASRNYTLDGNQNAVNNISAQLMLNGNVIDSIDFVGANGSFVFWDEATQKITIESGYSQSFQQVFTTTATNQSAFTDVGSTGEITIFRPNTDPQYIAISQIQAGDKIEVIGLTGLGAANNKFYEVLGVSIISANEIRIIVADANLVNITSGTAGNTPTIRHSKKLFAGNKWNGTLEVTGDLIVQGTTTTVNSETVNIADNIINLNSNYVGSTPTESAGIEVNRGTLAKTSVLWNETTDRWTFTNDGTNFLNIPIPSEYVTNIAEGTRTTTTVPITSSTGTGATLSAATTSLAGVMTAADKTKLDGIATNANNYSLPNATSSVTGGVRLGSDTQQTTSANPVTSTAARTYAVQVNASNQMLVNVPWVDTNTDTLQSISSDSTNDDQFITFVSNATGAQTGRSNSEIRVNPSTGTIKATNFDSTSDIRFKKDLEVITNALDKVVQLTGYTFTMIESNQRSSGLIAQDVEKVLKEAVGGNEDKKTVSYGNMMGLIVEALKELNSKVDKLQKQLEDK